MPFLLLWHPRVRTDTDTATVYFDLQPITVEVFEPSDAATVYLDLTPTATYLQVDFLLEIIEYTKRWAVGTVQTRWLVLGLRRRWGTLATLARWAILETRRIIWRF